MENSTTVHPHRHADLAKAQRRAKRFKLLVKGDPVPTEAQWAKLGAGLNQSDPLADAVVDWMRDREGGGAWPILQKAIGSGLSTLEEADRNSPALQNFFNTVEQDPDWLDRDKLLVGQKQIARAHPAGYYVLRDAGLMAGYLSSDLNKPLVMTGALSGGTSRRMAQTMKWYSDCAAIGGLEPYAEGYRSSLHVRILHATVRRRISGDPEWDHDDMGLPINQTDMAVTWLAFSVIYLVGIRVMGVPVSKYESECVMHLFHYACWLMGINNDWLTDDENEGRILLFQILSTFRRADESSYLLGQALMGEISNIPYERIRPVTWRWEQYKHLSTTRLFAGGKGMKQLGLPLWVPPVYPLACIPFNLVKHWVIAKIPSQRSRLEINGQLAREKLVALHFATATPDLAAVEK